MHQFGIKLKKDEECTRDSSEMSSCSTLHDPKGGWLWPRPQREWARGRGQCSGYAIKELSLTLLPAACHAWKAIIFPMTDHESATSVLNQGNNSCYLAACVLDSVRGARQDLVDGLGLRSIAFSIVIHGERSEDRNELGRDLKTAYSFEHNTSPADGGHGAEGICPLPYSGGTRNHRRSVVGDATSDGGA